MGLCRNCHPCLDAAPCAHGSVFARGGRHAISGGKFLAPITIGRLSGYLAPAYLASRYGRQTIAFIAAQGHPAVVATLILLIAIAVMLLYFW